MVKGLDVFLEYFRDYTDQYVLIGGAACSVSYEEQGISFGRITKDLDKVNIGTKARVDNSIQGKGMARYSREKRRRLA